MSQDIIKSEIDELFETMREQWEVIKAYEDKIPFIELDILMANVRKFYEDIYLIDKLNKTPGFDPAQVRKQITPEPSIRFEIKSRRPFEVPEPKQEIPMVVEPMPSPAPMAQDTQPVEEQLFFAHQPVENLSQVTDNPPLAELELPIQTEASLVQPSVKPAEPPLTTKVYTEPPVIKPAPNHDLFAGATPQTVADKYRDERKTIIEKLSETNGDSSLGAKMQFSQIADLKTAIGINDKFLFINELFKGDLAAYNRAINNLNTCQHRDDARQLLEQMSQQFKWNVQSNSIIRLRELVLRRFQ